MLALAAWPMGYRVHIYAPRAQSPAGRVAEGEIVGPYEDLDAVAAFARGVDVVTFEFENIPLAAATAAERLAPVRPSGALLHTTQNRAREKAALAAAGLPVVPHGVVREAAELAHAVDRVGLPAVLKTAQWGYDGKGQVPIASREEAAAAWETIGGGPAVLERFVDFAAEVSVVGARGMDGSVALFDLGANAHERHILDVTVVPAPLPAALAGVAGERVVQRAAELTREVLSHFQVVGVLCVEMFLLADGELLINEVAPRPHNSGHWTIDGAVTSQFEQQLRAICGLPLGSPERLAGGVAMANLLGEHLPQDDGRWAEALADPGVRLHLYGKEEARPGRKMGHLTLTAPDPGQAEARVRRARERLRNQLLSGQGASITPWRRERP